MGFLPRPYHLALLVVPVLLWCSSSAQAQQGGMCQRHGSSASGSSTARLQARLALLQNAQVNAYLQQVQALAQQQALNALQTQQAARALVQLNALQQGNVLNAQQQQQVNVLIQQLNGLQQANVLQAQGNLQRR